MKVMLYQHDPLLTMIKAEEEWKDLYGEEYANDFPEDFIEMSEEEVNKYSELKREFFRMSHELYKKYKDRLKK